jgi:hypothetical protein
VLLLNLVGNTGSYKGIQSAGKGNGGQFERVRHSVFLGQNALYRVISI